VRVKNISIARRKWKVIHPDFAREVLLRDLERNKLRVCSTHSGYSEYVMRGAQDAKDVAFKIYAEFGEKEVWLVGKQEHEVRKHLDEIVTNGAVAFREFHSNVMEQQLKMMAPNIESFPEKLSLWGSIKNTFQKYLAWNS
jgi:hypothetical protein